MLCFLVFVTFPLWYLESDVSIPDRCLLSNFYRQSYYGGVKYAQNESKKGGKDQESIQSSITPDPGYLMGK